MSTILILGAVLIIVAVLGMRYRTRQAERAHPPIGQFLEIVGVRLHYVERGQGQPLVLLHGNGSLVQHITGSDLLDHQSIYHSRRLHSEGGGFVRASAFIV